MARTEQIILTGEVNRPSLIFLIRSLLKTMIVLIYFAIVGADIVAQIDVS